MVGVDFEKFGFVGASAMVEEDLMAEVDFEKFGFVRAKEIVEVDLEKFEFVGTENSTTYSDSDKASKAEACRTEDKITACRG